MIQSDSILWHKSNALLRYFLAHLLSSKLDMIIVNEYPKSGGSWLAEMLSDIYRIPFPRNKFPIFSSSILHGHHRHSWNFHNVVNMWRDGRDIIVSQYYHSLFYNDKGNKRLVDKTRSLLSFSDYDDIESNLPLFIDFSFTSSHLSPLNWSNFANKWLEYDSVHIKYEDLLTNPFDTLLGVTSKLKSVSISDSRLLDIINRHSFKNITGRSPGQQSTSSFLRKGISGDWINHFSMDSRIIFDQFAGSTLINLGYEKNHDWVHNPKL